MNIVYKLQTIKDFENELTISLEALNNIVEKMIQLNNDSENMIVSKTGETYKTGIMQLLTDEKKQIEIDKSYFNTVINDNIIPLYDELYQSTKGSVE